MTRAQTIASVLALLVSMAAAGLASFALVRFIEMAQDMARQEVEHANLLRASMDRERRDIERELSALRQELGALRMRKGQR